MKSSRPKRIGGSRPGGKVASWWLVVVVVVGGQRWPAIQSESWQEETAEPKPKQGIVKGDGRRARAQVRTGPAGAARAEAFGKKGWMTEQRMATRHTQP